MSAQPLLIVEKYERVIAYLYPIIQNTPRQHGVVRDRFMQCLFNQVDLINTAAKSNQISALYKSDANLAMLRFYMRFYREQLKTITPHQETVAQSMIAEVGKMIGAWIKNKQTDNRGKTLC